MKTTQKDNLARAASSHFLSSIMAQAEAHYGKDTSAYNNAAPKGFAFRSYACCVSKHNPNEPDKAWFGVSVYDRAGQFLGNIAC